MVSAGVAQFASQYPFELDDFQVAACEALQAGEGVLVAAPTGAGKTVVGELAVQLALDGGGKCFYTTPIKALSNQKYADLAARYGVERVGLLTGDTARNAGAPVVVMTTEVLRNMLYAGSDAVHGLSHVVMDEVHYLSDRFRGAVWEEVIIHLPASVTVVSLSATVSNAEEFGEWLATVRGPTRVVVEEHRPVPLWQHVLVGHRWYDLFDSEAPGEVNPELVRRLRDEGRTVGRGPRLRSSIEVPDRVEVIAELDREGLLPAITFVFSRAGCDAAVARILRSGLRLNTPEERDAVRALVAERSAGLPAQDRGVLGYWEWLAGLERGVAAHHAGLLPIFKEITEELFARGLVKAVFATETLALGINMPARSVVLERLSKWDGEGHAQLTPGEYTQLTGRAGRRGIDVEGHAVVLCTPGFDPAYLAGLAATRTYPLRSSFRPTYNMAVNLVETLGRDRARRLLDCSFAQFQADRAVVGLARQVARNEEALAADTPSVRCERGDLAGYLALRRAVADRESDLARGAAAARRAAAAEALARLRVGDVVDLPRGRHRGIAVVVAVGEGGPLVVTADRALRRLGSAEVAGPLATVGQVKVPRGFAARSPRARRDLVSTLRASGLLPTASARRDRRAAAAADAELDRLRAALRAHPCDRCPERDEHVRLARRRAELVRETAALQQRVSARTGTLARTFDRVVAVLEELAYLQGSTVCPPGQALSRVYAESDLVVVECLRRGLWDALDPAGLAAVASTLVYESRRSGEPPAQPPPPALRRALDATVGVWAELHELEAAHRLDTLRCPDEGFAWAAHRWAGGARLETVLTGADLPPGDFVRWCKQTIDLLDQLADLAVPLAGVARQAVALLGRGVVTYA